MQPIPYLFFKDTAREAFETYGRIFGTEPEIMSFADMPGDEAEAMPGMPADAVMHAALKVGEGWIYASDDPTGHSPAMAGCNLHVEFSTEEETRSAWEALAEGGEIRMPLEPSFWAPLFGALTDRFGTRWMIGQAPPAG